MAFLRPSRFLSPSFGPRSFRRASKTYIALPTVWRAFGISPSSTSPPPPPPGPATTFLSPSSTLGGLTRRLPVPNGSPARDLALRYIRGDVADAAGRSERLNFYLNLPQPKVHKLRIPLTHGCNISSIGSEERGSLGVFLASTDREEKCYLLSACHVFKGLPRSFVQTPSHLDTLRELAHVVFDDPGTPEEQEQDCDRIFSRVKEKTAILIDSEIGEDTDHWHKHWAICEVSDGYQGRNGIFELERLGYALQLAQDYKFSEGMSLKTAAAGETLQVWCHHRHNQRRCQRNEILSVPEKNRPTSRQTR
jgi:hypothetical protein